MSKADSWGAQLAGQWSHVRVTVIDDAAMDTAKTAKAWSFAAFVMALASLLIAMSGCVCVAPSDDIEWPEACVWVTIAVCCTAYAIVARLQRRPKAPK